MSDLTFSGRFYPNVFKLTLAVYRVTDFFPRDEILKKQVREKANEVLGAVLELEEVFSDKEVEAILAKIRTIKGYLEIARSLRFVKPVNLIVLEREYDALYGILNSLNPKKQAQPVQKDKDKVRRDKTVTSSQVIDLHKSASSSTPLKSNISENIDHKFNPRQKIILNHLRNAKQAKISDFYALFSGISSKTIQRDLQDLVAKRILIKEGEKRWTTYSLNDVR